MKRWEIISIGLILSLGALLRLYKLPDALMFRGDQGRDAIVAKNILKEGDIALIGPVTSVGNMYLGPLYYYFMVPFLGLTYPDPVGPAYGVALLSILTIYLVYWVGKKTSSSQVGLFAALLFALMPLAIIYGRFSWNPNIAPFFSIIIFYVLYQWWQNRSFKTFAAVCFLMGLLIQTHYVSLSVAGVFGLLWLYRLVKEKAIKHSFTELGVGIVGFGLTTLPLVIFDFRHNHIISQQFVSFFTSPEKHIRTWDLGKQINLFIDKLEYILVNLLSMPGEVTIFQMLVTSAILLVSLLVMIKRRSLPPTVVITWIWLMVAAIGTSLYSHTTFTHYLTFCLPIVALFWGQLVDYFLKRKFYWSGWGLVGIILWICLSGISKVGWTGRGTLWLQKTVTAAMPFVQEPYNLALLSDDKDYKGMSYRYFFEVSDKKPLPPEDYSNLQTLVIVDETFLEDPRSVPIYEIEAAIDFHLEKKIEIPDGPWVYIYKKG